MKFIIILLLAHEPIYIPFDSQLGCAEQGEEIIQSIATYQESGSKQGWYTKNKILVYGFYCE